MSEDPNYKVGYGKPPREHQFKKDNCANPRGRPPKEVHAISPRQQRGDVIRAGEELISMNAGDGRTRKIRVKEAIEKVQIRKALAGHGPSIRAVLKRYDDAVAGHAEIHKKEIAMAERVELGIVMRFVPTEQRRAAQEAINRARKSTRFY